MNRRKLISVFFLVSPLIVSCQKEDISSLLRVDDVLIHDIPANQGVCNALNKARLVAEVAWSPLKPIPSCYASPYMPCIGQKGLPYSLAQKVNGYVGMDVSFYSFVTAVNNPRSVMYTEDLRHAPYYGFDCAPYYGSVCSMSIWYALGIKATYFTSSISSIPELEKKSALGADSIKLCDVLWESGHVVMIYDIGRDCTGAIQKVSIFETTRRSQLDSKILDYSFDEFVERWTQNGWVIYRPKDLSKNIGPDLIDQSYFGNLSCTVMPPIMNVDLCTNHGDRVSYLVGDSVVINILDNSCQYSHLDLVKDGLIYQSVGINNKDSIGSLQDVVFSNLPYGSYYACLRGEKGVSNITSFEIIDVNVTFVNKGNELTVYFSSENATPEFLAFVNSYESPHFCHVFSSEQLNCGSATVPLSEDDYLKVFFKGEYGRVSNKLIKVK